MCVKGGGCRDRRIRIKSGERWQRYMIKDTDQAIEAMVTFKKPFTKQDICGMNKIVLF